MSRVVAENVGKSNKTCELTVTSRWCRQASKSNQRLRIKQQRKCYSHEERRHPSNTVEGMTPSPPPTHESITLMVWERRGGNPRQSTSVARRWRGLSSSPGLTRTVVV
mmetsp:Transcript_18887/g.38194  ORF Transcript_18887/g.38194 Transcript_18887/m.38194 type:complete len:108 (-) Transcript_18887:146-469(-)